MPATYEPIATTTLSTATASVTFSTISGAYTDLIVVANCGQSQSAYFRMYFNGDTASNYSGTYLQGDGTGTASGRYSNSALYWIMGAVNANTNPADFNAILNVMNYSNSTTYKTVLARGNRASSATVAQVGMWRNTAAITSITIDNVDSASANFVSGSTFTLYGIKSA